MSAGEAPATRIRLVVLRRRRAVGAVAAVLALAMAAVWAVVVPEAGTGPGLRAIVVRWGHPACWLLLAAAATGFAVAAPRRLVEVLLWAALACYAAFLLATVV